jgi:hypothetical protein
MERNSLTQKQRIYMLKLYIYKHFKKKSIFFTKFSVKPVINLLFD